MTTIGGGGKDLGAGAATSIPAAVVAAIDRPIIGITASGEISSWNPAATAILGYPEAEAVGASLRQVLMNLITNAAEAIGGEHGTVTLRTYAVEGNELLSGPPLQPISYVCVEVADDGVGMDEDTRKRVFDPFFTTKAGGRGLGLATVLGFVRAHSGVVDISSSVGEGARFRVFLPTVQPVLAKAVQPASNEPLAYGSRTESHSTGTSSDRLGDSISRRKVG